MDTERAGSIHKIYTHGYLEMSQEFFDNFGRFAKRFVGTEFVSVEMAAENYFVLSF
jgi:hypothetical protein